MINISIPTSLQTLPVGMASQQRSKAILSWNSYPELKLEGWIRYECYQLGAFVTSTWAKPEHQAVPRHGRSPP